MRGDSDLEAELGSARNRQDVFLWSEQIAWLCGTFIVVLVFFTSTFVSSSNGFVSSDKYVVAVVTLAIFPAAVLFLAKSPIRHTWIGTQRVIESVILLNLAFILVGTVWISAKTFRLSLPEFVARYIEYAYVATLAAVLLWNYARRNAAISPEGEMLPMLKTVLVVVVPFLLLVASVLPGNWYVTFHLEAALWGGAAALLVIILWRVPMPPIDSRSGKIWFWSATIPAILTPFAMIDSLLSYDALHYTAYLGPATAVAAGRIPLIDVFSQYGQSYLVYNLGFLFLPRTYYGAALVTTFSNALYMLCVLVILRKLIRHHFAFLVLGVSLPFFFWLTYHYSPTTTPSHGGLRYLPVCFVATSLILMHRDHVFNAMSVMAIVIAWAWSFEAAVYSTFIYAVFLFARAATKSDKLSAAIVLYGKYLLRLVALMAVFAGLVCVAYLITTGRLPRYDLYLSLVMSYVGSDPFMDYSFYQEGFLGWFPVLVAYGLANALVVRLCFSAHPESRDAAARLAVISALGVAIGVYCLISTQGFILKAVLLPFFLLLYWSLDIAVALRIKGRLMSASEIGVVPVFVFLIAIMSGVAVGRIIGAAGHPSPIISIAQHFVQTGHLKPKGIRAKLRSFCSPAGAADPTNVCTASSGVLAINFAQFAALVDRWQRNSPDLLTFHQAEAVMEFAYKRPHTFPLSFAYVDGFSPELFRYIVDRSQDIIAGLEEGRTVLISRDLASLNELHWALLKKLAAVWELEEVERTEHLVAYRIIRRGGQANGNILLLPDRPIKRRNSL